MEQRFVFGTSEHQRLMDDGDAWRRWGPYLSERAWGTVREDYSPEGNAWEYLSHDAARSRAYRWNEDGLAGMSDDKGQMCFAIALWNGHDPILKERMFGVTGPQGNHGEDVKEVYFYLDSTPTHSYMRMLYKYPQAAFPYQRLIDENRRRSRKDPEHELLDTGIFDDSRYFDVFVEYAKSAPDDILIRIRAINRGPEPAILYLLPTIWFRNTWSWSGIDERLPLLRQRNWDALEGRDISGDGRDKSRPYMLIEAQHPILGDYHLFCEVTMPSDDVLFTNNDTNMLRLFGVPNATPYVKDAFHEYLVQGNSLAVNLSRVGTKACALYTRTIAAGESFTWRLRLTKVKNPDDEGRNFAGHFADFESITWTRISGAYTARH